MKRQRHPVVIPLTPDIQAMPDHVVVVIALGNSTIGLRFVSPEHLLTFFTEIMKKAVVVWPDNPLIKEYLSD